MWSQLRNNKKVAGAVIAAVVVAIILIIVYTMSEGFEPYEDTRSGLYQPGLNDETQSMIYDPSRSINIAEEMPWSESMTVMGLDQSVINSHNAWVKDATSGPSRPASNMPVSELSDGPVPFVGMFGSRPHDIPIGSSARQVSSEWGNQLHQRRRITW